MICKNQGTGRQTTELNNRVLFCSVFSCHRTFFTILIPSLSHLPLFLPIPVYSIASNPFQCNMNFEQTLVYVEIYVFFAFVKLVKNKDVNHVCNITTDQ